MEKIKILLVDDHKMVRDGLKLIINRESSMKVVDEASNGSEAIQYLESNFSKIDLILMDITMPELNGIEATEIISKLYPSINVLAITMHSEEAFILKMIKAGAKGYVLKDASKEILINAIETVAKDQKFYSNDVSVKLINALIYDNKPKKNHDLSDRELQVLKLVGKGKTNNEIAEMLNLSRRTIETHRLHILKKFKASTTAELIVSAVKKTNYLILI